MYLKSIKSHGFKSFADSIELDIKDGITGIVGPNGSGKSNIVDAVRWVLGEQSLKSLRGTNNMSDIIFAGSKSRKSMNRAYVSLTFDNSDKYLNTEFDTVEIKRVLYKTGENDYYINNSKVRLKDIIDLFIDSGAGKESYNIISQGSIADIINSKPEDRRIIFESASGVLKYKKRKEETNRKLIKVQDNLEKIDLIINELQDNKDALETQAQQAQIYLDNKGELEKIEVALIAEQITLYNEEYTSLKEKIRVLNEELSTSAFNNVKENSEIETLKLKGLKLDESISKINEKILSITEKLADLNTKKQMTIERKKYEADSTLIESNILKLKEEELTINKNIKGIKKDIDLINAELTDLENKYQSKYNKYQDNSLEKTKYENLVASKQKELLNVTNQIEILEDNIENDSKLPFSVKSVLNNLRLKGIHGTISKLIETNEKYAVSIDTVLGYSANIIVVDNEINAKEAINYLKANKLGRATFFPLNIIKSKYVDSETLNKLKNIDGFIDVASNLVKFDKIYTEIVGNQLGNVIVVDNIDTLNNVGKLINYRYRVVSLDGEILHTGGALAGGFNKQASNSVIMLKENLKKLQIRKQKLNEDLTLNNINLERISSNILEELTSITNIKEKINDLKEKLNRKKITLDDLQELYENKHNELIGTTNLKESQLDDELNKILEEYYKTASEKENLEKEFAKQKEDKNELFLTLSNLEKLNKEKNSKYNQKNQELNKYEIKVGKLDVILDNLLNNLSQTYNMTYEKAISEYKLDIDIDEAKNKISKLKQIIFSLGDVNTGAIEEFKRINERYTFLTEQKDDLQESIDSLNKAIEEMDTIMKDRFIKTFDSIKEEFSIVYKKLFKGGNGHLELTNPDDLLTTGIDIIAQPPGKHLNSIGLLSGGEKTLTAIALLFAILNVKTVPFVILDEVEAALDEANVETFGKYLLEKKNKSQFIIITHKKKTMEFADILYGITMQESGISKLVSVKLENM